MSKNIWRCRCGKRVEMLTDENFGDCGCSDPVYGPEYFYMSKECADMLDEMDKDYDEQHKHLEEARAEIENLKWHINSEKAKAEAALALNDRALWLVNEARARIDILERAHNDLIEEQAAICAEGQSITELVAKKDKLIEQMREALLLFAEGAIHDFHYVCQHRDNCLCLACQKVRVKAALSAAERGE